MKFVDRISRISFCLLFLGCLCYQTDVQAQTNEAFLDSVWRKEITWNLGFTKMTGEPIKNSSDIVVPRWAKWNDLEKYFIAQMIYPPHMLKKDQAGYSVVMFSLDTLGLPRSIDILETTHKEFAKEVVRLIKELPHCLPCRDKTDKRMECRYTAYVPFLPQQYRDRLKADSIAEEELKHCFVEWEEQAKFQDGRPFAIQNYIFRQLTYDPTLLGDKKQARGIYSMRINSYGEVTESKVTRSCGIQEWDEKVVEIIKEMPRWMPTINYYGKGKYQSSYWTVPILFGNKVSVIQKEKKQMINKDSVAFIHSHGMIDENDKYPSF